MRAFIFVTSDGSTFQPDSDSPTPDVENMQVLGFTTGIDEEEAFRNLLDENNWLRETSFNNLVCFELKQSDFHDHSKFFSIKLATK